MQVHAAHGVIQIEEPTIWQRLAPRCQDLDWRELGRVFRPLLELLLGY